MKTLYTTEAVVEGGGAESAISSGKGRKVT
jgi:hypothetical protein